MDSLAIRMVCNDLSRLVELVMRDARLLEVATLTLLPSSLPLLATLVTATGGHAIAVHNHLHRQQRPDGAVRRAVGCGRYLPWQRAIVLQNLCHRSSDRGADWCSCLCPWSSPDHSRRDRRDRCRGLSCLWRHAYAPIPTPRRLPRVCHYAPG